MAILGLTDQAAAFPIIGTLRKGEKKVSDNKPGKDLTYFRFVSEDALAANMFAEAYPDEARLRQIHVFLPHKTTDENMDSWIEEWVAGGLIHRCNGQTQVLWRTANGGYSTEPRPCENCKGKEVGRLSVIIPELGRFATVTILTSSKHDIINLTKQLRSYEALRGDLRGIPFVITRRAYKISTPETDKAGNRTGKRLRREKWLLSIETQPQWTMLQLTAMEQAALPMPREEIDEDGVVQVEYSVVSNLPSVSPFEEEPEPEDQPVSPPAQVVAPVNGATNGTPTNGNVKKKHPARPWTAEYLKSYILEKVAAKNQTDEPSEKQRKYAFTCLDTLANTETKRHTITLYLFGKESHKELTAAECSVIIDWSGCKPETEYQPNYDSVKEVEAIVAEYQREQGQMDMFDVQPDFGEADETEQETLFDWEEEPAGVGAAYVEQD